ncbi:unnamed protein product [Clavelina lepadiformis]|uniref:Uncharacterized protein n=1 Tax=Clavelina lepadiformis TaxID=159417 RepID=A0ABP0FQ77_CLALP
MLLDRSRKLYSALNLPRSVAKVYHSESLSYYGEAISRGEPIPKMFSNIEDDPHQLGGNFIVTMTDNQPTFSFIYRSATPADRPKVADILCMLQDNSSDQ